ncbi:MAG: ankyrin repeat domain-containing protein [Puniceicoccales bacterium]|jgi:ankyrin repeat protein|nr:ankyrin repeat domain-containing protein [Puniceicoccales bacterium]
MKKINVFKSKSLKSIAFGSLLLGSFAFSHLQASSSLLHEAVADNEISEVIQLLREGADLNGTDRQGNTLLHYANTPEMVELLCKKGANINAQNKYGDTPLLDAVAIPCPCLEYIGVLLANGANPDIKNRRGHSPRFKVREAIKNGIVYNGWSNSIGVDSEGKEIHAQIQKLFPSKIHEAVANNDILEVTQLLCEGTNPNETDGHGNTPLHYAGTPEMVELLCKNEANINAQNKYGDTPLHSVLFAGDPNVECVKALLKRGADKFADNKKGISPVELTQQAIGRKKIRNGMGRCIDVRDEAQEKYGKIIALFFFNTEPQTKNGATDRSAAVNDKRAALQAPGRRSSEITSTRSRSAVVNDKEAASQAPNRKSETTSTHSAAVNDKEVVSQAPDRNSETTSTHSAAVNDKRAASQAPDRNSETTSTHSAEVNVRRAVSQAPNRKSETTTLTRSAVSVRRAAPQAPSPGMGSGNVRRAAQQALNSGMRSRNKSVGVIRNVPRRNQLSTTVNSARQNFGSHMGSSRRPPKSPVNGIASARRQSLSNLVD